MNTETFEIDWPDGQGTTKKEEVIIKKLGFGEMNSFMERFIEIKFMGDLKKVTAHPFERKTHALQSCILKSPFKTDMPSLMTLDRDIGELIYQRIDKLNKIDDVKKKSTETS